MPNWCLNTVELTSTKEDIDDLLLYLMQKNGEGWFTFFTREESGEDESEEENDDDWYLENIERWGCKWNCTATNWHRLEETTLEIYFESPWAPPTTLYERIENGEFGPDWTVFANWHEPGLKYIGQFIQGYIYEYDYHGGQESLNDIPQDVIDLWDLRDLIVEC